MVRLALAIVSAGVFAASAGSPGAQVLPPLALPTASPEVLPPLALPASAEIGYEAPALAAATVSPSGPASAETVVALRGLNATDSMGVAPVFTNFSTEINSSEAVDIVELPGGVPEFPEKNAVAHGSRFFTFALVLSGLVSAGVFARSRKCGFLGELLDRRRWGSQMGDVSQDPLRADWGEWGTNEDDDDVTIGGPLAGGSRLGNSYERPSGI